MQEYMPFDAWEGDQSEDCLLLSVTTPAVDDARRPVIVWIHGGGLFMHSADYPLYDGATFAERGDVLFVNIQYRLGTLGWLDVSHLGGDEVKDSAINGLLDQVAALDWVSRNIANFGGDPDNVTIMGESAGGYAVSLLVQLPEAAPFFHKAIIQSGVFDPWTSVITKREVVDKFMEIAEADTLEALRAKSTKQLRQAEDALHKVATDELGAPDGMIFYQPPMTKDDLRRAGESGKPVLHGTTAQEYHFFAWLMQGGKDKYRTLAYGIFGGAGLGPEQVDELVEFMKEAMPERDEKDLYVDAATAAYMHYPHLLVSEEYGANAPVYTYLFDWSSPTLPELGAAHAFDLPFFFGNLDAWSLLIGKNPPEQLWHEMQDAVVAFARTGDPNHAGLPDWPAYDNDTRSTMRFGENSGIIEDPMPWLPEFVAKLETMLNQGE